MTDTPAGNSLSIELEEQLPASASMNIAALSRLFVDKTNSYKCIFFLSVLDILKRRNFNISEPIFFKELVVEMLANAWYPHVYFKLSFGSQDKIIQNLESLNLAVDSPTLNLTDSDKKVLRETIGNSTGIDKAVRNLMRYVPFRLIIPFLEDKLKEVPNRAKGNNLDLAIPKISSTFFNESKPLYRFDAEQYKSCRAIIFHPEWADYLEQHYSIVRGWASWEWLRYMQKRNSSTPGLIYKLFAPTKRASLKKQTAYWKCVLENTNFYCIYSARRLTVEDFSLDHYLPWSFIAHDQLWNLVPTTPSINSSKSNSLPPYSFLDKFVEAQHLSLVTSNNKMPEREWNKNIESYLEDLNIGDKSELLDLEKLRNAYSNVVQPLFSLATNQGFKIWQLS